MKKLTIGFAGTPEIAKIVLQKILDHNIEVKLVLTQMDRPSGRGMKLTQSPVKQLALQHNIEIFQPEKLRNNLEGISYISNKKVDLWVVIAYGIIVPQEFLDIAPMGAVNIHVSLLPHLRGAAPIQRAVLNGDTQTGVTIMQMDKGLDTGDILYQQTCTIESTDSSASLHDKLAILGSNMIIEYLDNHTRYSKTAQDSNISTYAAKLIKEEAQINWDDNARIIDRSIRGYNPAPVAYTYIGNNLIKIWECRKSNITHNQAPGSVLQITSEGILVSCGESSTILITQIQQAGGKKILAQEFASGSPDLINTVFNRK